MTTRMGPELYAELRKRPEYSDWAIEKAFFVPRRAQLTVEGIGNQLQSIQLANFPGPYEHEKRFDGRGRRLPKNPERLHYLSHAAAPQATLNYGYNTNAGAPGQMQQVPLYYGGPQGYVSAAEFHPNPVSGVSGPPTAAPTSGPYGEAYQFPAAEEATVHGNALGHGPTSSSDDVFAPIPAHATTERQHYERKPHQTKDHIISRRENRKYRHATYEKLTIPQLTWLGTQRAHEFWSIHGNPNVVANKYELAEALMEDDERFPYVDFGADVDAILQERVEVKTDDGGNFVGEWKDTSGHLDGSESFGLSLPECLGLS